MRPCGKQTFTCEPVETITATKIIDITKNLANNRLCTCSRICYHLSTNQNTCVELKNWVIIAFASVTSTFNLILYTCMLRRVSLTGVETFALWYHWKYKIKYEHRMIKKLDKNDEVTHSVLSNRIAIRYWYINTSQWEITWTTVKIYAEKINVYVTHLTDRVVF